MSRPRKNLPRYLEHSSGKGRLIWTDRNGVRHEKLLPGPFGSPESLAAKARLELELATSATGTIRDDDEGLTVAELLAAFMDHAAKYYLDPDGQPTKELGVLKYALKPVNELYPHIPVDDFGPVTLKAVRQRMIEAGLCRSLINHRINAVRRVFKWAVSEELVSPMTYEALRSVAGLEKGRTEAREAEPVEPVDDATVNATLPYLSRHVRAMIELMRHTGMRPAEACKMTLNQIERGTAAWTYRPGRHKTAHRGKGRTIPLGPKARTILSAFLADGHVIDPDEPIFSPRRSREERFATLRSRRKTMVQPSQVSRRKEKPSRQPQDMYTPDGIFHAVCTACDKAFPPPGELAKRKGESVITWMGRRVKGGWVGGRLTPEQRAQVIEWQKSHRWHPYQLRHTFATQVRKEHGLEAAQVLLGHSQADVTQLYAARDESLAAAVAAKIG